MQYLQTFENIGGKRSLPLEAGEAPQPIVSKNVKNKDKRLDSDLGFLNL